MSKTTVIYKDLAPGADENVLMSGAGYDNESALALLPFGVETEPVITLERNQWLLNGTRKFKETQTLAFWSANLSDEEGVFSAPPSITCSFTNQYSSTGITISFDRATGEYCNHINVKWYQGDALKADVDFYPNSTTYFCKQTVTSYDKIVITLLKTALPCRRARVEQIVFGIDRRYGMSELRSASVINETNGLSETLPISTFKFTLDSRDNVDFMFQLKQAIEIHNDNNLLGVYYIDTHKRKTTSIYEIECYDAIGVLSESVFSGGFYTNKSAKELLSEIVGNDFEIEYADDVVDTNLSGVLESGKKREAIQQVLFSWGVCMATDGGKTLRVFNLDKSLRKIGKDQTFTGVTTETAAIVTEIRVTAHSYAESSNGGVEIGGTRYSDTKTVYTVSNPDVTANDKQNVKEIQNATLVSPDNAQAVAQRVYEWYLRRNTTKAGIVWKGESLGDYVSFPNGWGDSVIGNVEKMEIKLSNTVVAKCEAVG